MARGGSPVGHMPRARNRGGFRPVAGFAVMSGRTRAEELRWGVEMGRWSSEPSTRPDRHEAPGVCGDPGTAALVETPRGRGRGGAGAVDRHRAHAALRRTSDVLPPYFRPTSAVTMPWASLCRYEA